MAITVKQMLEAANAAVPRVTPWQAEEMIAKGGTLVVDVRDGPEVEKSGRIPGAVHVSRGMLEFRADPETPTHDKNFEKGKTVIVYCASGGRSALSGKVLKDMGYSHVYNLGAFKDWVDSGRPVDKPSKVTGRAKRLSGIALTVAGVLAIIPPVLIIAAPTIAKFWHSYYAVGLSTNMLQDWLLMALFGGAGLIGGIWLITSARA